jgi:hypothetical protein
MPIRIDPSSFQPLDINSDFSNTGKKPIKTEYGTTIWVDENVPTISQAEGMEQAKDAASPAFWEKFKNDVSSGHLLDATMGAVKMPDEALGLIGEDVMSRVQGREPEYEGATFTGKAFDAARAGLVAQEQFFEGQNPLEVMDWRSKTLIKGDAPEEKARWNKQNPNLARAEAIGTPIGKVAASLVADPAMVGFLKLGRAAAGGAKAANELDTLRKAGTLTTEQAAKLLTAVRKGKQAAYFESAFGVALTPGMVKGMADGAEHWAELSATKGASSPEALSAMTETILGGVMTGLTLKGVKHGKEHIKGSNETLKAGPAIMESISAPPEAQPQARVPLWAQKQPRKSRRKVPIVGQTGGGANRMEGEWTPRSQRPSQEPSPDFKTEFEKMLNEAEEPMQGEPMEAATQGGQRLTPEEIVDGLHAESEQRQTEATSTGEAIESEFWPGAQLRPKPKIVLSDKTPQGKELSAAAAAYDRKENVLVVHPKMLEHLSTLPVADANASLYQLISHELGHWLDRVPRKAYDPMTGERKNWLNPEGGHSRGGLTDSDVVDVEHLRRTDLLRKLGANRFKDSMKGRQYPADAQSVETGSYTPETVGLARDIHGEGLGRGEQVKALRNTKRTPAGEITDPKVPGEWSLDEAAGPKNINVEKHVEALKKLIQLRMDRGKLTWEAAAKETIDSWTSSYGEMVGPLQKKHILEQIEASKPAPTDYSARQARRAPEEAEGITKSLLDPVVWGRTAPHKKLDILESIDPMGLKDELSLTAYKRAKANLVAMLKKQVETIQLAGKEVPQDTRALVERVNALPKLPAGPRARAAQIRKEVMEEPEVVQARDEDIILEGEEEMKPPPGAPAQDQGRRGGQGWPVSRTRKGGPGSPREVGTAPRQLGEAESTKKGTEGLHELMGIPSRATFNKLPEASKLKVIDSMIRRQEENILDITQRRDRLVAKYESQGLMGSDVERADARRYRNALDGANATREAYIREKYKLEHKAEKMAKPPKEGDLPDIILEGEEVKEPAKEEAKPEEPKKGPKDDDDDFIDMATTGPERPIDELKRLVDDNRVDPAVRKDIAAAIQSYRSLPETYISNLLREARESYGQVAGKTRKPKSDEGIATDLNSNPTKALDKGALEDRVGGFGIAVGQPKAAPKPKGPTKLEKDPVEGKPIISAADSVERQRALDSQERLKPPPQSGEGLPWPADQREKYTKENVGRDTKAYAKNLSKTVHGRVYTKRAQAANVTLGLVRRLAADKVNPTSQWDVIVKRVNASQIPQGADRTSTLSTLKEIYARTRKGKGLVDFKGFYDEVIKHFEGKAVEANEIARTRTTSPFRAPFNPNETVPAPHGEGRFKTYASTAKEAGVNVENIKTVEVVNHQGEVIATIDVDHGLIDIKGRGQQNLIPGKTAESSEPMIRTAAAMVRRGGIGTAGGGWVAPILKMPPKVSYEAGSRMAKKGVAGKVRKILEPEGEPLILKMPGPGGEPVYVTGGMVLDENFQPIRLEKEGDRSSSPKIATGRGKVRRKAREVEEKRSGDVIEHGYEKGFERGEGARVAGGKSRVEEFATERDMEATQEYSPEADESVSQYGERLSRDLAELKSSAESSSRAISYDKPGRVPRTKGAKLTKPKNVGYTGPVSVKIEEHVPGEGMVYRRALRDEEQNRIVGPPEPGKDLPVVSPGEYAKSREGQLSLAEMDRPAEPALGPAPPGDPRQVEGPPARFAKERSAIPPKKGRDMSSLYRERRELSNARVREIADRDIQGIGVKKNLRVAESDTQSSSLKRLSTQSYLKPKDFFRIANEFFDFVKKSGELKEGDRAEWLHRAQQHWLAAERARKKVAPRQKAGVSLSADASQKMNAPPERTRLDDLIKEEVDRENNRNTGPKDEGDGDLEGATFPDFSDLKVKPKASPKAEPPKPEPPKPSNRTVKRVRYTKDAKGELVREEYRIKKDDIKEPPKEHSSAFEKVAAYVGGGNFHKDINIPRALGSAGDISNPFRQTAIITASVPGRAKRIKDMVLAWNEKNYEKFMTELKADKNYQEAKAFGGNFAEESKTENYYGSDRLRQLAIKLGAEGIYNKTVAGSEHAYTYHQNVAMRDMWKHGKEFLKEAGDWNEKSATELAKFMNDAASRTKLGGDRLQKVATAAFFSPQMIASRAKILAQAPIGYKNYKSKVGGYSGYASRQTAKALAVGIAAQGAMYAVLTLLGKDPQIERDPRSSDFAKIRTGNTTFDPWAGWQQMIRTSAQALRGEYKRTSSGKVLRRSSLEALGQFVRSKLAPTPGLAVSMLEGKDVLGRETRSAEGVGRAVFNSSFPMTLRDLVELFKEDPVSAAVFAIPIALGSSASAGGGKKADWYDSPTLRRADVTVSDEIRRLKLDGPRLSHKVSLNGRNAIGQKLYYTLSAKEVEDLEKNAMPEITELLSDYISSEAYKALPEASKRRSLSLKIKFANKKYGAKNVKGKEITEAHKAGKIKPANDWWEEEE